jgi:arsenite methyltransferase
LGANASNAAGKNHRRARAPFPAAACCGSARALEKAARLGYTGDDVAAAPEGAELGLGCGNPIAIASIQPGETIVDLGSGGGFDCFLAARRTGSAGHVIGVDMTPDIIRAARATARKNGVVNIEFRLGEIEHLPIVDGTADLSKMRASRGGK